MIPKLSDLREPPVVGESYLVPVIEYVYCGQKGFWPVLGPLHSDAEFFNFPSPHYHVDARFLTKHQRLRIVRERWWGHETVAEVVGRSPLLRWDMPLPKGLPKLRKRKCFSTGEPYAFGDRDPIQQLRAKHEVDGAAEPIRKRDGRLLCPHRKVDLSSFAPDAEGLVTCPLHGLRVRCGEPGSARVVA